MRDYGMDNLPIHILRNRYQKWDFSGDFKEKAYMAGFRLGDLNVYKTSANAHCVVVRCHTTTVDQLNLIKSLFSKYGKVSYNFNINTKSYHINCFLNKTFEFLLSKNDKVENWIRKNNNYCCSYAAGYIDAEGNIGVYDGRARFKIDSYDKHTIYWFYKWFEENKIFCPLPKKIGKMGQIYNKNKGYKYNKDLWRVRVSDSDSLRRLLKMLKPYLRHRKRMGDANKCLKNIDVRRKCKKN